ncbi:MAG: FAD-binding oxidoreductase [Alphaproteobacteria bacterium]|nr:FAD-binding oxidoreductase [Alphaproteobacteria bacterium]
MLSKDTISTFKAGFRGEVIEPSDRGYNEARALYNAMIDKKPRLIARCVDVADVIAAVNFGRENKVVIAIRGGGHNGPGLGSVNDGLVIDLSRMKGVRVDPASSTVRAEPGCTQGDVDHATHPFGLAVPAGIVSTTGIAGLTLGGGTGYLTRAHGLTIDNLIEVDVVLADGRFLTASETQNADLFWALRGGGGNFGVVTSFAYRAAKVGDVYGGPIFYDIKDAAKVMRVYRDTLAKLPVKLGTFLGLKTVPSTAPFPEEIWGRKICALISCFNGSQADGEAAMKPLLDALPKPIMNGMGFMPFPALQALFDPLMPKGLQWYWKGDFVKELPDEAIDAHIKAISQSPSELSLMHLYPIDGAVHRVGPSDTAWNTRDARWNMVIAAIDPDPRKANELKKWGRAYWEAVHPFNMGGAYVNFMMDDENDGRVEATYGTNFKRLSEIKKKYDPQNLFRVNQNIRPA